MKSQIQAYRLEAELKQNGTLTLHELPFQARDCVEVIVLPLASPKDDDAEYSLRGLPIEYDRPFDGVVVTDWNAAASSTHTFGFGGSMAILSWNSQSPTSSSARRPMDYLLAGQQLEVP